AAERMLPVHAIDEPVQVLDQARHLALLELALEAVEPLRREVLHDDPVLLLRGGGSMGGGEQGQRRVIALALEPLQLGATDHRSPLLRTVRVRVSKARARDGAPKGEVKAGPRPPPAPGASAGSD